MSSGSIHSSVAAVVEAGLRQGSFTLIRRSQAGRCLLAGSACPKVLPPDGSRQNFEACLPQSTVVGQQQKVGVFAPKYRQ
jgi:hypothetical protein